MNAINGKCLLTVIVPVYNVEKYIKRCVDSILSQTYKNLEIILVDDGSKDNSGAICDEYKMIDSRIKVIHKQNGGLSSARNAGLLASSGKYIGFVDSDDWIEKDMFEYLFSLICGNNADASQVCYVETSSPLDKPKTKKEKVVVKKEKDILNYYMIETTKHGTYSVCICLFEKTTLKNIFFREGFINEDIDFKYKALSRCNTFVASNQIKYFYYQSSAPTISTGGLKRKDFQLYDAAEELYKLTVNEAYGSISKLGKVKKARTAFSLLAKIAVFGISDDSLNKKEIVKRLTKENRHNWWTLMNSPIPFMKKIIITLFAISFPLSELIIHFLIQSKIRK